MSLKLTELRDYCIVKSGQFIIDDISDLNFNLKQFWTIVRPLVKYYDKYRPVTTRHRLTIAIMHRFPDDKAPEWVSRVYPTGLVSQFSIFGIESSPYSPIPVIFKYEKPILYLSNGADVEVTAHYNRKVTVTEGNNNEIEEVVIEDLEEIDDDFMNLVFGHFLMAIGKSRRSFILSEFPVQMDAAEMVNEGQSLIDNAEEAIKDKSYFQLALGG